MKFRTEITISPFDRPIGYRDRLLSLGSCFADEIGTRLAEAKFPICCNPSGPLFNPLSILALVERALFRRRFMPEEVQRHDNGACFLYDLSTRFTEQTAGSLLQRANALVEQLGQAVEAADHLLITFGTAWVYRLAANGAVVANCHKQPQRNFCRERLTVEQIVAAWSRLIERLPAKQIILTVSPIRHLGDGLEGNAVSKAVLRLACEELAERHTTVRYFPAYEMLMDDLRDYRFYADDLCHPSRQAVEYIWEHFTAAALTEPTRRTVEEVRQLTSLLHHRPLHPESEAYRRQCSATIERMEALAEREKLDFSEEIATLRMRM